MLPSALGRLVPRETRATFRAAPDHDSQGSDSQQSGILRAGFSDGQRSHRNAAGHLHDGKQRIHALQRLALDGNAQHGHKVLAATMPGKCAAPPAPAMITCKPRASALDAYSTIHSACDAPKQSWLHAARRRAPEYRRMAHRLPVGLAAHDDANQRLGHAGYCPCAGAQPGIWREASIIPGPIPSPYATLTGTKLDMIEKS